MCLVCLLLSHCDDTACLISVRSITDRRSLSTCSFPPRHFFFRTGRGWIQHAPHGHSHPQAEVRRPDARFVHCSRLEQPDGRATQGDLPAAKRSIAGVSLFPSPLAVPASSPAPFPCLPPPCLLIIAIGLWASMPRVHPPSFIARSVILVFLFGWVSMTRKATYQA